MTSSQQPAASSQQKKRITILGATGSIGESALAVIAEHPEAFEVTGLAAHSNIERLAAHARAHRPARVAVWEPERAEALRHALRDEPVDVLEGIEGLTALATDPACDLVLVATSGVEGLRPLLAAVAAGKAVALANKESLVIAGELIMAGVAASGSRLIPVDSEHSALFQCLQGLPRAAIARLYIMGSGGPLREVAPEALHTVDMTQVLNHPRWKMGRKITVDSATLMNKGLEVIEAHWLFGQPFDRMEVLIHPEAVVHAMVELVDGTLMTVAAACDMRLPIQYAFSYPERLASRVPRLAWAEPRAWHFEPPNPRKFPCLALAWEAARAGGTAPAILNAANEVAVLAYLDGDIAFVQIPRLIEAALARVPSAAVTSLDAVLAADAAARAQAREHILVCRRKAVTVC